MALVLRLYWLFITGFIIYYWFDYLWLVLSFITGFVFFFSNVSCSTTQLITIRQLAPLSTIITCIISTTHTLAPKAPLMILWVTTCTLASKDPLIFMKNPLMSLKDPLIWSLKVPLHFIFFLGDLSLCMTNSLEDRALHLKWTMVRAKQVLWLWRCVLSNSGCCKYRILYTCISDRLALKLFTWRGRLQSFVISWWHFSFLGEICYHINVTLYKKMDILSNVIGSCKIQLATLTGNLSNVYFWGILYIFWWCFIFNIVMCDGFSIIYCTFVFLLFTVQSRVSSAWVWAMVKTALPVSKVIYFQTSDTMVQFPFQFIFLVMVSLNNKLY